MKASVFATRNHKEIIRDPLTLIFGMGLPILMMGLFSVMQKNMPFALFEISNLTPGVIVFSFSFLTLFSGMLLGKDKSTSFLMRIFASPMSAGNYIVGYVLPLLPIALLQIIFCLFTALFLGLSFNISVLIMVGVLIIISLLYIGVGLLFGTIFTDKQVGGIFAIFVNLSTWFSGTWFEPDMVGGTFQSIAQFLPFVHAVHAARAALSGAYSDVFIPLSIVLGYTTVIFVIATFLFQRKMRGQY
ncbi:ABC transporter permease [Lysinibacillus sp. G4S2]|uniref:ABC transporter permease n=1 Tax=Lysinibacillus sp. G4S2 TaxID=3055859 RepID=UPI0025A19592|nr:ABC transporter permease [Lysinibacillus sp. G4S2]MDM5249076.1 ABC transporter permease [Lysinibacillus sp. G4S2]